jgi:hypothetical protein
MEQWLFGHNKSKQMHLQVPDDEWRSIESSNLLGDAPNSNFHGRGSMEQCLKMVQQLRNYACKSFQNDSK